MMLGIVCSENFPSHYLKRVDAMVGLRVETDNEVQGFDVTEQRRIAARLKELSRQSVC